jgi:acyl dehydratase
MALLTLEDLPIGIDFACGSFRFTCEEIIAFAAIYDPQPFHLDEAAAQRSYFRGLCASGVHSQAAAIGLVVRATANVAVVAGGSLDQARFLIPVRPDRRYDVTARWTDARPAIRNPTRGVALIRGSAREEGGALAMTFGVTYIVARDTDPSLAASEE